MTHAVILAAGTGSRFGGDKLLALLDGTPLIAHVEAATAHLPTTIVTSPTLSTAVSPDHRELSAPCHPELSAPGHRELSAPGQRELSAPCHPERNEQSERSRGTDVIINPAPERGMAHSLRLADAAIDPNDALLVLLGDMPWITRAIVDAVIAAAGDADVCYPVRAGIGGHPVYFSPRARAKIAALPDGDSLRSLRDDPSLTRVTLPLDSDAPYRDVDMLTDLP